MMVVLTDLYYYFQRYLLYLKVTTASVRPPECDDIGKLVNEVMRTVVNFKQSCCVFSKGMANLNVVDTAGLVEWAQMGSTLLSI